VKKTAVLMAVALLASAPGWAAFITDLGQNITIPDGVTGSGAWYTGVGQAGEDNEVEPGCTTGQLWDLEAFYLNQNNFLTMVGGYDFENGASGSGHTWKYGDLFIDVNNNAVFGQAAAAISTGSQGNNPDSIANTFGYDYVLTFRGDTGVDGNPLYRAYKLDPNDSTLLVYYNQNAAANPWRYDSGGTELFNNGSFSYFTGLGDDLDGDGVADVLGGTHNAVRVDLTWLWDEVRKDNPQWNGLITTHFTMECGNDNLMGQGVLPYDPGTPVPEPASLTLMGLGIAAVAVSRLRKKA